MVVLGCGGSGGAEPDAMPGPDVHDASSCPAGDGGRGGDAACVGEAGDASDGPACTGCTGECVGGRCLVTLASPSGAIEAVTLDSTYAYWSTAEFCAPHAGCFIKNGQVERVPKSGGRSMTIATNQGGVVGLAVDDARAYWSRQAGYTTPLQNDGAILSAPKGGGTVETLASGQAWNFGLTVAGPTVYWLNAAFGMCDAGPGCGFGFVMSVPKAGGTPSTLIPNIPPLMQFGLAADTSHLYFSTNTLVMSEPLGGGHPSTLVDDTLTPTIGQAVADDAYVYYLQAGWGCSADGGACEPTHGSQPVRVAKAGGTPETLAASQESPTFLGVDDTSLYWWSCEPPADGGACDVNTGFVVSMPKAGGEITTLATDQPTGWPGAVDSTSLYWSTSTCEDGGACTSKLMKLTPK